MIICNLVDFINYFIFKNSHRNVVLNVFCMINIFFFGVYNDETSDLTN